MVDLNVTTPMVTSLVMFGMVLIPTFLTLIMVYREQRLTGIEKLLLVMLAVCFPLFGPLAVMAFLLARYGRRATVS